MDSITQSTQQNGPAQQLNGLNGLKTVINAMSVDVEEYYHATIFKEATTPLRGGTVESRVEGCVDRILRLFAEQHILATFFVLGEVAVAHPLMVKRISQLGHEVACHGYDHELVSRQSPREFRANVSRAKSLLEELIGQPVIGYRAPSFSIGPTERWAYDVLLDEGFRYDSSIYPVLHDRYGQRNAPRFPYEIQRNGSGGVIEFPIGTTRLLGMNLPIGGGGWFRLLPLPVVRWGIQRVNAFEGKAVMFYFHPWELDVDLPIPPMLWHQRFRLYVGLARTEAKIKSLILDVRFTTVRCVLGIE